MSLINHKHLIEGFVLTSSSSVKYIYLSALGKVVDTMCWS